MLSMFIDTVDDFLSKLRHFFKEPIKTSNLQLVTSLCNLMECLMKPNYGFKYDTSPFDKQKKYNQIAFVFSLIWSLGTTFYDQHQDVFDQQIRKVILIYLGLHPGQHPSQRQRLRLLRGPH